MKRLRQLLYALPCIAICAFLLAGASTSAQDPGGSSRGPTPRLPSVSYRCNLDGIFDDMILVWLDDGSRFRFKRSGKTAYYRGLRAVDASELHSGDRVVVEARQDGHAFLVATKVTVQPLAPPADSAPEK